MKLAKTIEQVMTKNGLSDPKIYRGEKEGEEDRPIVKVNLDEEYSLIFKPIQVSADQGCCAVLENKNNGIDSVIYNNANTEKMPVIIRSAKAYITDAQPQRFNLHFVITAVVASFILGGVLGGVLGARQNRICQQSKSSEPDTNRHAISKNITVKGLQK